MKKLKFVGLFIGLGLVASAAMADNCYVTQSHAEAPGTSVCRGTSTNPSNLTVQTCNGNNGQWQNSGQKCTCNPPAGYSGWNGQWTCTGPYTKS